MEKEGKRFGRRGDFDAALATFQKAKALDPDLDPQGLVDQLRPQGLLFMAGSLIKDKKVEEALEKYREAERIDPTVKILADDWNRICWFGMLQGLAHKVLDACEKAVALSPDFGGFRDSRGVAKAMSGDLGGVVEDFEAYVRWAPGKESQQHIDRRKRWIEQLRKGGNPFSPEHREKILQELRDEG